MNKMTAYEYHDSALAWFDLEELHKAVELCSEGIYHHPEHEDLYGLRSTFYEALHDYQAALDDIDRYIELKPKKVRGYAYKGHLLLQIGRFEDAEHQFDQAIKLSSNDLHSYMGRATARARLGKENAAISDLTAYYEMLGDRDIESKIQYFLGHFTSHSNLNT